MNSTDEIIVDFDFKKDVPLEKRLIEIAAIKTKYPDRIPIICEIHKNSKLTLELDKKKFLIPNDLTVGQFLYVIRKRIKLAPEHALFIFTDKGVLPAAADLMSMLYKENKDIDGFLYLSIMKENTFGTLNGQA